MLLRRKKHESYEEMRRRMIGETELALLYGLRFPERTTRIPTLISGTGSFHRSVTVRYWAHALGMAEVDVAHLNEPPSVESPPVIATE